MQLTYTGFAFRFEHRKWNRGRTGLHQLGQPVAPSILFPVFKCEGEPGKVNGYVPQMYYYLCADVKCAVLIPHDPPQPTADAAAPISPPFAAMCGGSTQCNGSEWGREAGKRSFRCGRPDKRAIKPRWRKPNQQPDPPNKMPLVMPRQDYESIDCQSVVQSSGRNGRICLCAPQMMRRLSDSEIRAK